MPPWVVDLGILVVIALMTYALASEGLWGASLMFFNILFAALIAFNCYEFPAAQMASNTPEWLAAFADVLCLMGIFIITLLIFRVITSTIAPSMVRFPIPLFHLGRLAFALAAASLATSMILMAFYVSPVHKKVFGTISYDTAPPFKLGIDHKWLGFFQYTTGKILARYGTGSSDPYREYGKWGSSVAKVRMFDPEAKWLLEHETARPFGKGFADKIADDLEGESPTATPDAGAGGGAPPGGGGAPPGGGGGAPKAGPT